MIMPASRIEIVVEHEVTEGPQSLATLIAGGFEGPVIGDSGDPHMSAPAEEDAVIGEAAGFHTKTGFRVGHVAIAKVSHLLVSMRLWKPAANQGIVRTVTAEVHAFERGVRNQEMEIR